ncbi:MAG: fatty acid desaturase [Cyanobacteria bacterium]|nr:fatty acid desaturase [Cyanobacteriota bacterium]
MSQTGKGLLLAAAIAGGWLFSLQALLTADLARLPLAFVVLAVLVRTFLQTGLFIIGHDAMHGVLLPLQDRLNQRLGQLALALYACLPYQRCLGNHCQHHSAPASSLDPDFLAGAGPLAWYGRFMAGYLSVPQMAALLTSWAALLIVAWGHSPTPALNVLVACVLPLALSSLQLFAFGTYLPHRGSGISLGLGHQVRSLDLPEWLSLLACYHFGYHLEHHQAPGLPWFALPSQRRSLQSGSLGRPKLAPARPAR